MRSAIYFFNQFRVEIQFVLCFILYGLVLELNAQALTTKDSLLVFEDDPAGISFGIVGFHEGIMHGSYTGYYDSASVAVTGSFAFGVVDGKVTEYHRNGEIKGIHNYEDGMLVGVGKFFYKNGNLKEKANYINGELDGEYYEYWENGQVFIFREYKNGMRHGVYKRFDSDGKLVVLGKYIDDELQGELQSME